jgi:hypothetical protein
MTRLQHLLERLRAGEVVRLPQATDAEQYCRRDLLILAIPDQDELAFTLDEAGVRAALVAAGADLSITTPADIATLGWVGNYAADWERFKAVDDYIRHPSRLFEEQREALYLMSLHGVGIDEPVTDAELKNYVQDGDSLRPI